MRWIVYLLLSVNLGLFIWKIRDHQQAPVPLALPPVQGNQVNRLPLLSEMSAGALRAREPGSASSSTDTGADSAVVESVVETADSSSAQECYTVGPLQDVTVTEKIREWLQSRQASIAVREDERRETARYWVYFPPLASRKVAVERVTALRDAGIDDLIIIPRGDMSNAISLGVYTRKSSVKRRLSQLQAKGYHPTVAPRYRTVKATWVDVLVIDEGLDMGTFPAAFPSIDVRRRQCSAAQIASTPKSTYNPLPQAPQRQYEMSGQESVGDLNDKEILTDSQASIETEAVVDTETAADPEPVTGSEIGDNSADAEDMDIQ